MRENKDFRATLEWLSSMTDKNWLNTSEIARLLKVDRSTVVRRFGINAGCALPELARRLTESR